MEFNIKKIYYNKTGDFINIEPIGDIHVGSKFFDKKKFMEVRDRILNDPSRMTIVMGDIFDATLPDNKFFDVKTQDEELPSLALQFQWIKNALLPIKDKIIGIHCGNHDERLRLRHYEDYVARLAMELGVPYLSYMAITRLVFFRKFDSGEEHNDGSFDIFSAHGGYAGRYVGGNLNSNEQIAMHFSADIYLTAHTHQVAVHKKEKIAMDAYGHLQKIVKIFGVCGSFLQPYNEGTTSYPEYKIMPATRVGTITVSIDPYNRKLQAHE